jgi:hypothetical protein
LPNSHYLDRLGHDHALSQRPIAAQLKLWEAQSASAA